MSKQSMNPFSVITPEGMDASLALSLFVDVFTDFHSIKEEGHAFLHGPRGSGKSMMFRYLEPDCQMLARKLRAKDLPFYAVYVSIKTTNLNLTEMARLDGKNASIVLNEHFMTIHITSKIVSALKRNRSDLKASEAKWRKYYLNIFCPLMIKSGLAASRIRSPGNNALEQIEIAINNLHAEVVTYLRKLSFTDVPQSYDGALLGYVDFLIPLVEGLKSHAIIPNGPFYLLLDDADNLSAIQTIVLNSWVSTRTSQTISLKISTALRYKTWRTASGATIETPHDFVEVDISSVYTSRKTRYKERVKSIVKKRLAAKGISTSPERYFPPDAEQEAKIAEISKVYKNKPKSEIRGFRVSDDVTRYSRPDFIKHLYLHRSAASYSYSGFEQLVHISSGIIRHFLDAASEMYSIQVALPNVKDEIVTFIEPNIQNKVVRDRAENLLFNEFERITKNEATSEPDREQFRKLGNLLRALGGAFRAILHSSNSERRVFSIALSSPDEPDVSAILKLGVLHGYFHEASIGNKEGTGRTRLYILTRRLAPAFTLDPTSFAGYQFVTNDALRLAMSEPNAFISRIENKRGAKEELLLVPAQRPLPLEV